MAALAAGLALAPAFSAPRLSAASPSAGAAPAPPPAWMHRSWTARDGAPRFIQALAQDRDGFLWVGSVEGLFRFDGTTFAPVTPAPGHPRAGVAVSALAAAPDGTLWVGHAGGGGVSQVRIGPDGTPRAQDMPLPSPAGEITRIVVGADGAPWIAAGDAEHAVWHRRGARWEPVAAPLLDAREGEPHVLTRRGTLWLTTWGGPLLRWQKGATAPVTLPGTVPGGAGLAEAPDGALWLIANDGLRRLPEGTGTAAETGATVQPLALPRAEFWRAVVDPYGRLWATTFLSGLVALRPGTAARDGGVEHIGEREGLSSDRASPILADREGSVWVGTERGLDRFVPTPIAALAPVGPRAPTGLAVTGAGGSAWLANGTALWSLAPGVAPRLVQQLAEPAGALCAGGPDGTVWAITRAQAVAVAGGRRGTALPLPRNQLDYQGCAVAPDGTLWLADTALGVARAPTRPGAPWQPVALPAAAGSPSALAFDARGRLWAVLGRRTVARIEPAPATGSGSSTVTLWQAPDQPAPPAFPRPTALFPRRDAMLVGGATGLLRIPLDARADTPLARLDAADHPWLADVRALADSPAPQGANGAPGGATTWLLGYRGAVRLSAAALDAAFAVPRRPIAHELFDDDDRRIALPQRGGGTQAVAVADGRVVLLTRSGALVASDWRPPHPRPAFRVFIAGLSADGRTVAPSPEPVLPVGTRTVTIGYGALDLVTPAQRRFRVRLAGVDADWTDNGAQRQITYANLGPGTWRFAVETDDGAGTWQAGGATLVFTIRTAWWQTTWFRTAAALGLLVLAAWLYQRRTRFLVERARATREGQVAERERIARELHDTLLQGVQGMMLRFAAIGRRGTLPPAAQAEFDDVLERGDDVIAAARDRVIDLRHAAGEIDLMDRIAALVETDLAPTVALRTLGAARPVCAPVAEDIAAIAREAVANARRHAGARAIALSLEFTRRELVLRVVDDGRGFDTATSAPGHFGLVGMHERATRLGARLALRNAAGGGALVELRVPARIVFRSGG